MDLLYQIQLHFSLIFIRQRLRLFDQPFSKIGLILKKDMVLHAFILFCIFF
jgi:gamma-glutamylcysteine synthetase